MSRDLSPAYTLLTKPGALHGAEWPLLHTKPVTPIKCIGEGRLVKEREREREPIKKVLQMGRTQNLSRDMA